MRFFEDYRISLFIWLCNIFIKDLYECNYGKL